MSNLREQLGMPAIAYLDPRHEDIKRVWNQAARWTAKVMLKKIEELIENKISCYSVPEAEEFLAKWKALKEEVENL